MASVYHKPLSGRGKPKRTEYGGRVYDSKTEADYAAALDMLQRAGDVLWWYPQVAFQIGEPGVDKPYRVDFLIQEHSGAVYAVDVKGFDTASTRRHIAQWRKRGPFPLHIIRGKEVEVVEREET